MDAKAETEKPSPSWLEATKSNAWTDLALTVPIFVGYHVGVIGLDVRNAADPVTSRLVTLAANNTMLYWGLTLGIGLALVAVLGVLGRGQAFEGKRFLIVAGEGVIYAVLMRFAAAYVVGRLALAPGEPSRSAGLVMSLGAGFYEELTFRVGLFGLGTLGIRMFWGGIFKLGATLMWAVIAAALFSGWHYIGALGDTFELRSFVFRFVCGLVFTAIYALRGFAPAVWTHALYDVWVLVLR